ncbi:MAG: hypothetical protein ACLPKB_30375 [Xanthobacteraceae bacterium]
MAIYRLIEEHVLEPELAHVMSTAYEDVLHTLGSADRTDPRCSIVAKRVTELALVGEDDPRRIRQQVLHSLDQDLLDLP